MPKRKPLGVLKPLIKTNLNKGVSGISEVMEYTSLWLFNVFVIFMFGWFYFYFYSMFVALADINEDLISLVHKKTNNGEVEGQTKLSDFIEEE